MRVLIKIIAIAVSQIVIFIAIHEIGVKAAESYLNVTKSNLDWGITLRLSLWVFSFLALLFSVFIEYVGSVAGKILLLILVSVIFCIVFVGHVSITPYRTLLLYLSAILGFLLPFLTIQLFKNRVSENK